MTCRRRPCSAARLFSRLPLEQLEGGNDQRVGDLPRVDQRGNADQRDLDQLKGLVRVGRRFAGLAQTAGEVGVAAVVLDRGIRVDPPQLAQALRVKRHRVQGNRRIGKDRFAVNVNQSGAVDIGVGRSVLTGGRDAHGIGIDGRRFDVGVAG